MPNSAVASKWDKRFMELADTVAGWSDDPTTKVGCVLVGPGNEVLALGYNGLPRGIDDSNDTRTTAPGKYLWIEHAERNAIFAAARLGASTRDGRMYVSWFPCADCARAIVQAGIKEVVGREPDLSSERWGNLFRTACEIFVEAGVSVRFLKLHGNLRRKVS